MSAPQRASSSAPFEEQVSMNARSKATDNKIIDTIAIETLLKHREKGTWFVFDIDNVLGKTVTQLASDQWFRWRCSHAKETGEPFENALNHWTALQLLVKLEPVEKKTASVVKQLQEEGFPTFAITSRGIRLGDRTVSQINAIGCDFSANPVKEEEVFWPRGLTATDQEHVLFEKGILFTAGQNKGTGLTKMLGHLDVKPKRIVFIDDSRKHVEHVAEACDKLGIKFIGYHYRRLESWVAGLDKEVEKERIKALEYVLSEDFTREIALDLRENAS